MLTLGNGSANFQLSNFNFQFVKVAVVILNWNGEQMLRRFLPSVVEHSVLPEALGEAVVCFALGLLLLRAVEKSAALRRI